MTDRLRINPQATENARALRGNLTLAERRFWQTLRGRQIEDHRFRRQHPVGPYIADFACVEKRLIVELDGGQHQEQIEYDMRRTAFLQLHGWQVLRFWNNDVMSNLDGVLAKVIEALSATPLTRAAPSQPSP